MSPARLVWKNLFRKKLRTFFTVASIVIAFILFGLLGALDRAFNAGLELAGADRLITMHRVSFIETLPINYVSRIESIEGVENAGHYTWFGAYYQDPKQQFGLFPTEMETLRNIYPEYEVPEDQWQALLAKRDGLLVGKALATALEWKLGDTVPLGTTIWSKAEDGSYSWDFEIMGIFEGKGEGADEMQAFMHYDYFNEGRAFGTDRVGWIVTKITDPDAADAISATIDDRFRNSPTETKTTGEKAWAAGFAAQFGNIGLIVKAILACVFFTLLLVAGNTMAQAVRERTSELAVMKTLGFSDARVMRMILAESLMIAAIGGGVGLLLAKAITVGAGAALARFLPSFDFSGAYLIAGIIIAILLGLVTGAIPAWNAMRLKVVDALGRR